MSRLLFRVLGAVALAACSDEPTAKGPACATPCGPLHLSRLDLVAGRPGGPGWVDGTLASAHFADPWTMAKDDLGRIYVADGMTIRVIDASANRVTTLAGAYRKIGCVDGVGAQATFNTPSGLAFGNGALYLTDTENSTIRKIDVGTGAVATVAGACQQAGAVDAAGSDARFRLPGGIVFDATGQNLYIADTENDTIRVLAVGSGAVTTVAGTAGTPGSTDGVGPAALFRKPTALTIDAAGILYAVDSRNYGVRQIAPGAGPGAGVVSTLATWTVMPNGLAMDGGSVLVSLADDRIVSLAPGGAETGLAGSEGAKGFVDGIGAAARFDGPAGLLDDGAGTLYVADEANAAIRRVALSGVDVSTFAGVDSAGYVDGPAPTALFRSPQGLAADATFVYVADTDNDVIRRVTLATGAVTTLAGSAGQTGRADGPLAASRFDHPKGLALDGPAKRLFVVDAGNRTLRVVDLTAGAVSSLVLARVPGDPFPGFSQPAGIALADGRLFVTDYDNDTVLAVDVGKAQISTLAGQTAATGSADGAGVQANFYGPLGIAFDGAGNLWIADSLNDTVRKIVVATGAVSTIAGEPAVQGDNDGIGAAAHFSSPISVAADPSGDLLVSDLQNNRVRRIDAASRKVTTLIGGPVPGVRLGPLPAQLMLPGALALTPSGGLLVVSENAVLLAH